MVGATSASVPVCRPPLHPSRHGKLCLVLDLDHTLLNSATFSEVGPVVHAALEAQAAREAATLPADQRLLFRMDAIKVSRAPILVLSRPLMCFSVLLGSPS